MSLRSMKLTKKRGGVIAAVVMAGGLTAASATSAFADSAAHGPKTAPVAKGAPHAKKDAEKDAKKDTAKTHPGRHHRRGMHGERTVKGKDGKTVVHEWQAGTVAAVGGNTVTVKSADGFSLTWTVDSATKLHAGVPGATGATGATGAIVAKAKVGDKVFVEGVKSGSANQAHVLVDRTARRAAKGDHKTAPTGKHRKPSAPHGQDQAGSAAAHTA